MSGTLPAKLVATWAIPGVATPYGGLVNETAAAQNIAAMKLLGIRCVIGDGFQYPVQIENLQTACDGIAGMVSAYGMNLQTELTTAAGIAALTAYATQAETHTSALQSSDDRYVVFVYGASLLTPTDWATIRAGMPANIYLVGEPGGGAWSQTPINQTVAAEYLANWDAAWNFLPPSPSVNLPIVRELCANAGIEYLPCAMPQYYGSSGYEQPSDGGVTYIAQFQGAAWRRASLSSRGTIRPTTRVPSARTTIRSLTR